MMMTEITQKKINGDDDDNEQKRRLCVIFLPTLGTLNDIKKIWFGSPILQLLCP